MIKEIREADLMLDEKDIEAMKEKVNSDDKKISFQTGKNCRLKFLFVLLNYKKSLEVFK